MFYSAVGTIIVVFLQVTGSLCSFLRRCLPYTRLNNKSLSVFFHIKDMSREKGASVSTQLEQLHTCLPFRLSSHLCVQQACLCVLPSLSHRMLARHVSSGSRFNEINFLWACADEESHCSIILRCHCQDLAPCSGSRYFIHYCFCNMLPLWKRQITAC